MASIFTVFGEYLIDNTKANKSIDDTTTKAEKSGSKVGSAFGKIAKGAVAVGTAVVGGQHEVLSLGGVIDVFERGRQLLQVFRGSGNVRLWLVYLFH